MEETKPESIENMIYKILGAIEEKPYCSSDSIALNNFDNDFVLNQLKIILREKLILAEPAVNESGEVSNLFNIRLTLKGLKHLKKLNSIFANS
ncbi:MAG TPA: hypothetical protein VMT35_00845 [Ignavibacteriaceae bacterium]|nr:hypothetical protein [Ignavibacteriaceae bacterium]